MVRGVVAGVDKNIRDVVTEVAAEVGASVSGVRWRSRSCYQRSVRRTNKREMAGANTHQMCGCPVAGVWYDFLVSS